jgi:hypothetical protein
MRLHFGLKTRVAVNGLCKTGWQHQHQGDPIVTVLPFRGWYVMGPDQAAWALRVTAKDRYSD